MIIFILFTNTIFCVSHIQIQNGIENLEVEVNLNRLFRKYVYLEYKHTAFLYHTQKSQPVMHKYEPQAGILYNDFYLGFKHLSGGNDVPAGTPFTSPVWNNGYDMMADFGILRYKNLTFIIPLRNTFRGIYSLGEYQFHTRLIPQYYNVIEYHDKIQYKEYSLVYKLGVNQIPELNFTIRLYYDNFIYVGYMQERTHHLHDYKSRIENVNLGMKLEF